MDGAWWGHQRVPWEGVKCPPSVRRVCPYKWFLLFDQLRQQHQPDGDHTDSAQCPRNGPLEIPNPSLVVRANSLHLTVGMFHEPRYSFVDNRLGSVAVDQTMKLICRTSPTYELRNSTEGQNASLAQQSLYRGRPRRPIPSGFGTFTCFFNPARGLTPRFALCRKRSCSR